MPSPPLTSLPSPSPSPTPTSSRSAAASSSGLASPSPTSSARSAAGGPDRRMASLPPPAVPVQSGGGGGSSSPARTLSAVSLLQGLRQRREQAEAGGAGQAGEEKAAEQPGPAGAAWVRPPMTPWTAALASAAAEAGGENPVEMPPLEVKTRGRKDLNGPAEEELQLSCCTGRSRDRAGTVAFHALHLAAAALLGGAAALVYESEGGADRTLWGVAVWRYLAFGAAFAAVMYVGVLLESLLVAAANSSALDRSAPWPTVIFCKALAVSSGNIFAASLMNLWWEDVLERDAEQDSLGWVVFRDLLEVWLFLACTNAVRRWVAGRAVFKFNMDAHLGRIRKLNTRARLINDLCGRDSSQSPLPQLPVDANGNPVVHAGRFSKVLARLRRGVKSAPRPRNRFELRTGKKSMGKVASRNMYEVGAPAPPEAFRAGGRGGSPRRTRKPRRAHTARSASDGTGSAWKMAAAPPVDLSPAGHVNRTADLLMKRLDPGERGYFTIADLEEIYVSSVALEALEFFEVIPDGKVERQEVTQTLHNFFRDRQVLRQNILAYQQLTPAIKSFFAAMHWAVLCVAVPILFGLEVERTLLLFGTLLVSVSFAIGGSIRDVIDSYVFLVYRRPFVVGERIQLNVDGKKPSTMKFWVESISLLSTTLRGWDNGHNQISNAQLSRYIIKNLSRSPNAELEILVDLPFDTPVSVLKRLAAAVLEHTRRNRSAWTPIVDTYIYRLDRTRGLTLSVWLISNLPMSNSRGLLINATAVCNVIRMFLTANGVRFVETEMPVRIVGDEDESSARRGLGQNLDSLGSAAGAASR